MTAGTLEPTKSQVVWPADPYKGLTYYERGDFPLFAGRNADTQRVSRILADGSTRILLLHGSTGCGKSSFLRAALIPFLERGVERFSFAREAEQDVALFVRATHDPLLELATKAWELTNSNDPMLAGISKDSLPQDEEERKRIHPYAIGPVIDRGRYKSISSFASAVAADPERLVDTIGRIAYRRPRTQALVVDQGEEILTLKPGRDGEDFRRQFFMFLSYLSRAEINFRLIIAFRTEYHGRLFALLKAANVNASGVGDYFMSDLAGRDLIEAIERPTSLEEIPGWGIPREHYRFYYQRGLPATIAQQLEKTPLSGGVLPVLQIVCRRLYQKAKAGPQVDGYWVIRNEDLKDLSVARQVDLHLQKGLESAFDSVRNSMNFIARQQESVCWRDVLSELAKPQADGTVTTDVKPTAKLAELAPLKGCKLPFEPVMEFLRKDEWKIVRPVDLTKPDGAKIPCYSLGHDVLGGVLETWKAARKSDREQMRKSFLWVGLAVVGLSFTVNFWASLLVKLRIDSASLQSSLQIIQYAGFAIGIVYILFASLPEDSKAFANLTRAAYSTGSFFSAAKRLPRE
ncbi:MAG: ATP-binding protein [Bryobacterales bacterium]|nr:ATP-binding protein [Bryobacterales bacterium]MBV9401246.1 ATP-binding protein [Bryobacterales bacterium]